jgi:hypothetical protein
MGTTTFSGPVRSLDGFIGTTTGNVTGDLTGRVISTVATRSGAGAVPTTAATVRLTTTGANALTLADGVNGQTLVIVMVVDGGDGTLTPATKTGYSTIVFTAVGNAVTLQFLTTVGWMVIDNYGATVNP